MTFRVKMLLVALGVARANVYIDRFLKSFQLKILGASKLATSFHRASFLTPENENTESSLSPSALRYITAKFTRHAFLKNSSRRSR